MEGLDPGGSEVQRRGQFDGDARGGGVDLFFGDAEVGRGEPVETRGVVEQCRVAPGADIGDDDGDDFVDGFRRFPRLPEQGDEGGFEVRGGGGEADHAAADDRAC